jgi:hypothetical protein
MTNPVGILINTIPGKDCQGGAASMQASARRARIAGGFSGRNPTDGPIPNTSNTPQALFCYEGPERRFAWLASFAYAADSCVSFEGDWYHLKGANGATDPKNDAVNWELFSVWKPLGIAQDGYCSEVSYPSGYYVDYQGIWYLNGTAGSLKGDEPGHKIPTPSAWTDLGCPVFSAGDVAYDNGVSSVTDFVGYVDNSNDGDIISVSSSPVGPPGASQWLLINEPYADDSVVYSNGGWYRNLSGAPSTGTEPSITPTVWALQGAEYALSASTAYLRASGNFSALSTGTPTGIISTIMVPFQNTDIGSTLTSTTKLPGKSVILRSRVIVMTEFDTADATLTAGYAGSAAMLRAVSDTNLLIAAGYHLDGPSTTGTDWSMSDTEVTVTLAGTGAGTKGKGYFLVEYCTPNS